MALEPNIPVPLKSFARILVYRYYSLIVRLRPAYEYIFLLSHMRSGSSLMTHLLVNNPDICGYGETHIGYSDPHDFNTLVYRVLFALRRFPMTGSERYVLDKVLHDAFLPKQSAHLLLPESVKVIFLLRSPEATLRSLINVLGYSEEEAAEYYLQRLATLETFGGEVATKKSCAFVTYEQLVERTEDVFALLQRYLNLHQPLSERYAVLPTTGRYGIGDMSPHIRSGRILRSEERAAHPQPVFSKQYLKQAHTAFDSCASYLTRQCITIENN